MRRYVDYLGPQDPAGEIVDAVEQAEEFERMLIQW